MRSSGRYIGEVRKASRSLVRELGFMSRTIAGTDLSASAVHAIIEIGSGAGLSAKDLSKILCLEKSTISRLIKSLIERGLVRVLRSDADSRIKLLHLSRKGVEVLREITQFGEAQVSGAIKSLDWHSKESILAGLRCYSSALKATRTFRDLDLLDKREKKTTTPIIKGYRSGIIGEVVSMHAQYYSKETGFGATFETKVAGGMAEFIPRLDQSCNQIWSAEDNGQIVASIAIDGEALGNNIAQLRWFIVGDEMRGRGIGRQLIGKAVRFCDEQGFDETHLWTLKGLEAAQKLYEAHGFVLAREYYGEQWGPRVLEQKYTRATAR